ncbi:putative holin-like toxin [Paenibacillus ehimensis]
MEVKDALKLMMMACTLLLLLLTYLK